MSYKEKTCPTCATKHNKRGPYCSRSCGNSRTHTEEHKRLLSKKTSEWLASDSDTAEESKMRVKTARQEQLGIVTEPVAPPVRKPLSDNQFVQDGDLWSEC